MPGIIIIVRNQSTECKYSPTEMAYFKLLVFLFLFHSILADIQTKSGLNRLYNEKVVKVEHVKRPMDSSGTGKSLPVPHHGVRFVISYLAEI